MEKAMQPLYLSLLMVFRVSISSGQAEEPCELGNLHSQMFVPLGEWVLQNCTFNCPDRPIWETRLLKRNIQWGPTWTSVEVLVDDWQISNLYCLLDTLESMVVLMAYALPSNVTIDLDEQMKEGKVHHITCTVYDVAPVENLHIQLLRGNTVIHNAAVIKGQRGKQTVNATYALTASRMDNLQNFSCLATLVVSENLTVSSSSVTVRTYGQPDVPIVTIKPESHIQEGNSFQVICLSEGSPRPEYHWTVPAGANVTYTQNNSIVLVRKAGHIHNGTYTCEARNRYGRVSTSQNVLVTLPTQGGPRRHIGDIISAVLFFIVSLLIYYKTRSPASVDSQ